MGPEISELCGEQLNTLAIGDDLGFLCWKPQSAAGHLLLWNFAQQPWACREIRLWGIFTYTYTHTHICIYMPHLCGAMEQSKRKRSREVKKEMISWSICSCSDHKYPVQWPASAVLCDDAQVRALASQPRNGLRETTLQLNWDQDSGSTLHPFCQAVLFWFEKTSLFTKELRNVLKNTPCLHATLNNEGLKHILKSFLIFLKHACPPVRSFKGDK